MVSPEVHLVLADSHVVLEKQIHLRFPEVLPKEFQVGGLPDVGLLFQGQRLA